MPIDKGTSKPITQLSGLQINYKDEYSCFNPPIVTTAERDSLVNTDDPAKPIKDGTHVFNSDIGYEEYYSKDKNGWIQIKENAGGGDVSGPVNATNNNVAVFDGTTGKKIKDGGVTIDALPVAKKSKALKATPLYKLSNLGALQFGSNENTADTGVILVDGLTPVTFQTQGIGADSRVCTVINGELGEGSSSPSALLEINSSEGGFLNARLTTAQRDSLLDPKDGLVIYNNDTKNLNLRQNNVWVEIGSGSSSTILPTRLLSNSYYNATLDDCVIITQGGGSYTVNLPEITDSIMGKLFIIIEGVGIGNTNNVTVQGKISGLSSYVIKEKFGYVSLVAGRPSQGWLIISKSVSDSINNKTKKSLIYNKDNPPPKQINLISDLFPNTNSIKLTIISSGGNGGKGVGTNNGAGGGGGAVLVACLNNIHSTKAKYIWISLKDSDLLVYNTWVAMNSSDSSQSTLTDFRCLGNVANMNGSDGNSSVNIGGLGASPQVLDGSDYPPSNYTWYGFKGTNGQGCSPNTSYSGSGGSSAVGQGAYGVGFNSNGLDSIIGYGGGGSGGNGDGKLGGSGGGYGTIIFEWEE